ncbi:MAG: ubiquitin-like small modifier protein 2 [Halolamina sp.]
MEVAAEVVGEGEQTVTLPEGADYATLVEKLGYSPHEVTVLVDESPVPEDAPVTAEKVQVLRLVAGG